MQERRLRTASRNPDAKSAASDLPDHDLRKAGQSLAYAKSIIHRTIDAKNDRQSLVSDVACEIGAEIIEGILQPGDNLSSIELARRFATSRTPIREALMLLEKEGLVVVSPRRRARVVSYSLAEVKTIYSIRMTLLELLAADVAGQATEADLAELRAILARMKEAALKDDVHGFFWANVEFNERNTLAARNPIAKRIVDSLQLRTLPLRRLSLSISSRVQEAYEEHAQILRAYECRDSRLAAALIRSNHVALLAALETTMLTANTTSSPRERRKSGAGQTAR